MHNLVRNDKFTINMKEDLKASQDIPNTDKPTEESDKQEVAEKSLQQTKSLAPSLRLQILEAFEWSRLWTAIHGVS